MSGVINVLPDPSEENPRFAFNTGAVVDGQAVFYPTLPNIPGPTSDWSVVEWDKNEYLDPSQMSQEASSTTDPLYGPALYSWSTPDGESAVSVYGTGPDDGAPYVYQLSGSGGVLTNGGGANVFLSAAVPNGASGWVSLDHPVNVSLDAKISEASASYNTQAAMTDGTVLGQMFIGFVVQFNEPSFASYNPSLPTYSAFVQIRISDSSPGSEYGVWSEFNPTSSGGQLDYGTLLPGGPSLSWEQSEGTPQTLSYSLNQYVEAMLQTDAGELPTAAMDLGNWSLTSVYIGLETESSSPSDPDAGSLSEALQISNLSITTDPSETYNPSDPPPNAPLEPNAQTFLFVDETTGVSGQVQGSVYTGPVVGLEAQYIYQGSDKMVFSAPPGSFIVGGPSGDAIAVTGGGSVIDGGGGSNWLVGGTDLSDPDTFFLGPLEDEPDQTTWSTITNFHLGDDLTMWGYNPHDWIYNWVPDMGAQGATGLTLWARNEENGSSMLATFNGLTAANQSSLAIGFGTSSGGTPYLLVTHI